MVDLGAAPGGWTQVAVENVLSRAEKPTVLAIDKDSMSPVNGAKFIQGDLTKPDIVAHIPQ